MNEMAKIHAFLVEMERSLTFHSVKERHDILRETQSHLTERAGAGRLDDALQALGSPKAYAEQFAGPAKPVPNRLPIPGWPVAMRLGIAGAALVFAVPALLALAMELVDPVGFGLWVSLDDGHFVFGKNSTSNPNVSDIAGHLMLPASALLSGGFLWSVWASVRSALFEVARASGR
jgi:hypothetical protein